MVYLLRHKILVANMFILFRIAAKRVISLALKFVVKSFQDYLLVITLTTMV